MDNFALWIKLPVTYNRNWWNAVREDAKPFGLSRYDNTLLLYGEPYTTAKEMKLVPNLHIEVRFDSDVTRIRITNSIRQWLKSKRYMGDLKHDQLLMRFELIAQFLHLPIESVLDGNFTRLEFGATLFFDRDVSELIPCMMWHNTLGKFRNFNNQTMQFEGEHRSLVLYDKPQELYDTGLIKLASLKTIRRTKLNSIRTEVSVNKVVGVDFVKNELGTPRLYLQNWNKMLDYWRDDLKRIHFSNIISPGQSDYLNLNSNSQPAFKRFVHYKAMEGMGTRRFFELVARKYPRDKRKLGREYFDEVVQEFHPLPKATYRKLFFEAVNEAHSRLLVPTRIQQGYNETITSTSGISR